MIAAIHFGVEEEIRKDIIAAQKELEIEENKVVERKVKITPFYRNVKKMSIAASIALIISLLGVSNIWFSNRNLIAVTTETLKPLDLSLRGTNSKDSFEKGTIAFKNNAPDEAIQFFEKLTPNDENYIDARYHLAYIQLQTRRFQSAIDNAKIVYNKVETRPELKNKAEWLQIRAMLSLNQTDTIEFRELLSKVTSNEKHLYYKNAIRLQAKLNSFWRKLVF